ncbi:hypothetical protein Bpfe_025273 [Biomphalaria pfeifferi]|uniref:Uncharacterized protein n=1 Tax=Biomphalaria pfeifferi TaxID=112525 RepID=A0AAD8B0R8_BIOPF|nr:hypothetical protein Bpfe_025273 [Biomphalaria pfeifferi]
MFITVSFGLFNKCSVLWPTLSSAQCQALASLKWIGLTSLANWETLNIATVFTACHSFYCLDNNQSEINYPP